MEQFLILQKIGNGEAGLSESFDIAQSQLRAIKINAKEIHENPFLHDLNLSSRLEQKQSRVSNFSCAMNFSYFFGTQKPDGQRINHQHYQLMPSAV